MKRLLLISLLISILSINVKAQIHLDTLVNINFNGITIKQALNEISEKYDIRFSYSDSKIPVNDTINENFDAVSLFSTLKTLLHQNEINFNIIGDQIVLFPFNSNQTIIIRGKVLDQSSGSPIPFANILLSGTRKGTSSNEDGEFQLALHKLPSELLISHLSHEKKLVYIYDDAQEVIIELFPAQTTLQEITVSAKRIRKSNYHLVKKAFDILNKSKSEVKYGKAFYRQKSQRENKYTEIFELFYDIKYTSNGIADWAVQEGRYAFQNDEEYDIFLYNKNFTLLSRLFPIQQPSTDSYIIPINSDVKKYFDIEYKDVIKYDERFIAILSYTPKSEIETPIAQGEIFIDLDTYQVLKIKGSITNEELDIISFNDANSNWENYQLDFQISFIDDQDSHLLMDFIQIDHQFEYYFKKEHIGKIKTSSILTFYEHYSPPKNKRLGGAINFAQSDMDLIDRIGYNSAFWSQNPIVKRTPLEENLIRDFELNEAFGVVFMNKDEEVVLLPDKQNTEKAKRIISRFEEKDSTEQQRIFLLLDKEDYLLEEKLRFSAYVLDQRLLKPFVYGSVLTVEIFNNQSQLLVQQQFDISEGMAYGEINLSEIAQTGMYQLKAYTNTDESHQFKKSIRISYNPSQLETPENLYTEKADPLTNIEFFPEGGNLINDVRSKVVFTTISPEGIPIHAQWHLINQDGSILSTINSNILGVGSFEITPEKDFRYYLKASNLENDHKWEIFHGNESGFCMKITSNQSRSIQVEMNSKPATPREIYLISTNRGKILSFYEKKIQGKKTTIDLPITHLPGGVNTLVALDNAGKILAKRSFFVHPEKLYIELESAIWKSKKSNRVRLKFKIFDQEGNPSKANLNAVCSSTNSENTENHSINNYLYFGDHPMLADIDYTLENDSVFNLLDEILIIGDSEKVSSVPSVKSEIDLQTTMHNNLLVLENPFIAEINVSANYSANSKSNNRKQSRHINRNVTKDNSYWIPKLEIDGHGAAYIDYKLEARNRPFYVNIQGVSHLGLVGNRTFRIDLHTINSKSQPTQNEK